MDNETTDSPMYVVKDLSNVEAVFRSPAVQYSIVGTTPLDPCVEVDDTFLPTVGNDIRIDYLLNTQFILENFCSVVDRSRPVVSRPDLVGIRMLHIASGELCRIYKEIRVSKT